MKQEPCRLTFGEYLLPEDGERVPPAVLLLHDHLVPRVQTLVVQLEVRPEVVQRDVTQRLHALLVSHGRLGAVKDQAGLMEDFFLVFIFFFNIFIYKLDRFQNI